MGGENVKLNDNIYDVLKWVAILLLPATSAFIGTVGQAIDFEYTAVAVIVVNALAVFLGTILGISTRNYNKDKEVK